MDVHILMAKNCVKQQANNQLLSFLYEKKVVYINILVYLASMMFLIICCVAKDCDFELFDKFEAYIF